MNTSAASSAKKNKPIVMEKQNTANGLSASFVAISSFHIVQKLAVVRCIHRFSVVNKINK